MPSRTAALTTFARTALALASLMAIVGAPSPLSLTAQVSTRARDSGSVSIVENRSLGSAPEVFTLGRVLLDVGGLEDDPANEFDARNGYLKGVILSDGSLAAIDVSRIQFFDGQGRRQRIVGGAGRGPEEFDNLTDICRTGGDSLIAVHTRSRRISVLTHSGDFVRSTTIPFPGVYPVGCIASDEVLLLEWNRERASHASLTVLQGMRTDGSERWPIGTIPGPIADLITGTEVRAVAAHGLIYGGDPGQPEVRMWDRSGNLVRVIRTEEPTPRMTATELEERLARIVPTNVTPTQQREFMRRVSEASPRRTWPAYQTFFVSANGTLWIQRFSRDPRGDDVWVRFDSTGVMVGSLRIPAGLSGSRKAVVVAFGDADVLLRRRDSDDAFRLTRFAIVRR